MTHQKREIRKFIKQYVEKRAIEEHKTLTAKSKMKIIRNLEKEMMNRIPTLNQISNNQNR